MVYDEPLRQKPEPVTLHLPLLAITVGFLCCVIAPEIAALACVGLCVLNLVLITWGRWGRSRAGLLLSLAGVVIPLLLLPAVEKVRLEAARAQANGQLFQIAFALHLYHDAHQHLPPAAVCDENGKPLLSWRVLLLPYLEGSELFRQFKLDEPWDGPTNLPLLTRMPHIYAAPGYDRTPPEQTETYFQLFTGPGTAFPAPDAQPRLDELPNTTATIIMAEAGRPVPWTQPVDLVYDPAGPLPPLGGIFTQRRTLGFIPIGSAGFHIVRGDATRNFISIPFDEDELRRGIARRDEVQRR